MNESTLELKLNLGETLALVRNIKGITQEKLAEESGLSRTTISKIEAGDADPKLSTISELSEALDVTPVWLLMSKRDLEIITEIAESGDLENILEVLSDDLIKLVETRIRSGRRGSIQLAFETVESVLEGTADDNNPPSEVMENIITEKATQIAEGTSSILSESGIASSPTMAIGTNIGSKIGTAVGVAWWEARSKLQNDE